MTNPNARVFQLEAENKWLKSFLALVADSDGWPDVTPSEDSRNQLPEDWQVYVAELELQLAATINSVPASEAVGQAVLKGRLDFVGWN